MLNDERRSAAIAAAVAALDLAGKTVFEIGTGSGVVALLFAKLGARHVFTCESNENLARAADDIIGATPYADRITIIHASSREVVEERLLTSAPDIIFTETIDCGIVGEGFFAIRRDIQEIAGPRTIVLPARIEQHGVVIESLAIRGLNEVTAAFGFDVSALNRFATSTYFPVRARLYPFCQLSAPTVLRTYDYLSSDDNLSSLVRITRPGIAHGLLSWFRLDLGATSLSNPFDLDSHWHQAFHPFPVPIRVETAECFCLRIDDAGAARIKSL